MTAFLHHFGDGLCIAAAGVFIINAFYAARSAVQGFIWSGIGLYIGCLASAAALIAMVLK